ncbi:hypothetical protein CHS0354_036145 [Potamilus streckersoni]|uniref:Uncharacterized protein n=1 Tax=Potamilus streckersoni TaxID=2493646 RepID=A0AAE0T3P5_9BIVA|nr:hypothetical protein CHS0354_036145 [Potamilus streckersoni]
MEELQINGNIAQDSSKQDNSGHASLTKTVDSLDNFVIKFCDTMVGNLDVGSKKITMAILSATSDLTNRNYDMIAGNIASRLAKFGDMMTGMLNLGSNKMTTFNPVAQFDRRKELYLHAEIIAVSLSKLATADANYLKSPEV